MYAESNPICWIDVLDGALFVLDFDSAQTAQYYDTQPDKTQMDFVDLVKETSERTGNYKCMAQTLHNRDRRYSVASNMLSFTQRKTSTLPIPIPARKSVRKN